MKLPAITTAQMIEVDRLMIEVYGISLLRMMENAGRNLAEMALRMLKEKGTGKSVAILCGAGNNGGGGMVAARHLHNRGADVHLIRVGDSPLKEIPAQQWEILSKMGLRNEPDFNLLGANLIIDAMIGYGLKGNPHSGVAKFIDAANASGKPILSLDAPSGLDTSSGAPGKPCIHARNTLTLALPKVGLITKSAKEVVGDLYLADISVPPDLYKNLGLDVDPLFFKDTIIEISNSGEKMSDLYIMEPSTIVMYSTTWCSDCARAKKFLNKKKVDYIDVDIEADEKGREFVMQVNNGARVVPTIIFPDGDKLIEPSSAELRAKFG